MNKFLNELARLWWIEVGVELKNPISEKSIKGLRKVLEEEYDFDSEVIEYIIESAVKTPTNFHLGGDRTSGMVVGTNDTAVSAHLHSDDDEEEDLVDENEEEKENDEKEDKPTEERPDSGDDKEKVVKDLEKGALTAKEKEKLEEKTFVKNKKTGNVYKVKTPNPDKHTTPSKGEVEKAKAKDGDGSKKDTDNVEKQKTVEKDKSLGDVDNDYYGKDIDPTDESYENSKPEQQQLKEGESPTKLPDDIFGTPPKVPKKYIKLVERLMNSRLESSTKPPITSMIDGSGAGKIQAQAGEVLSMIGPTLSDEEFKNFMGVIRKHNEKLPQKLKNDGTSYNPPKYEKGSEPILSEDWLKSVEGVRSGINERYNSEYGEGNWEVENGAWDLQGDVEAMGLSDYGKNKGFSTDMYLRVRDKKTGESKLDEVSLKKDLDIFLSQPSVNAVSEWGVVGDDKKEYDDITRKKQELKSAGKDKSKEYKELVKREKEILKKSNDNIPKDANPKVFNKRTTESATNFYENVSEEQHQKLQQLDENDDDYINSLSKTTGQDKDYCRKLVKTMKNLKHPYSRAELRQAMIDNGFKSKKTTDKYQDKLAVMMMRTLKGEPINDESASESLDAHLKIGKDFNKSFVDNMVKEPYKSGVMSTIREKFPLKSLMEGEEKMSLGGVSADPQVLEEIFGTTDYDTVQEKLSVQGPDDKGEYQLVFKAEVDGDVVPISTIAPRQRGLGYEPVVNLEMNLHPAMKEKLYCANKKVGRDIIESDRKKYDKKYKCS